MDMSVVLKVTLLRWLTTFSRCVIIRQVSITWARAPRVPCPDCRGVILCNPISQPL